MCGQISGCQGVDNGKNCTAQGCSSGTNAWHGNVYTDGNGDLNCRNKSK